MRTITASTPRLLLGCLALVMAVALAGCTVVPRQSGLASTAENVAASNAEIRTQLYGNTLGFGSAVQRAADEVLATSKDPVQRRNALEFKIRALSTAQVAVGYRDPLVGLMDMWALSIQLVNYYRAGDGRDDFGEYQAAFVERLEEIPPAFEHRATTLLRDRDISAGARLVNDWANAHPIEESLIARPWMVDTLSTFIEAGGLGAAGAMGEMAEQLGNISDRLAIYYNQLPTQMRWESQLFLEDILRDNFDLRQSVDSITAISASLGRVVQVAETGSPLLQNVMPTIRANIHATLYEILDSVDVIRFETLAEVDSQVALALATLQSERALVLASIDTLTYARVDQALSGVRRLLWLAIIVGVVVLVGPFVLGYVVGRALGRANARAAAAV